MVVGMYDDTLGVAVGRAHGQGIAGRHPGDKAYRHPTLVEAGLHDDFYRAVDTACDGRQSIGQCGIVGQRRWTHAQRTMESVGYRNGGYRAIGRYRRAGYGDGRCGRLNPRAGRSLGTDIGREPEIICAGTVDGV